jgi:PAS domain S-box-containing protein
VNVVALVAKPGTARATRDLAAVYDRLGDDLLENMFFAAPEGMVIHRDGLIIKANAPFLRMFGFEHIAQVLGSSIYDLVAPEDTAQVAGMVTPNDGTITYQCMKRDGTRILVETRGTTLNYGDVRCRLVTAVDVTGLRRGEAQLREANERFRLAFNDAPIGMALVSPEGRWLHVNSALCDIVGYTADELLHITFQDITHPEDLETDLGLMQQVLAGERASYSMEKRYFHADGHVVWVNLHVSLVRSIDGAPRYFISQIEDVTQRKQMVHALTHETATVQLLRRVAAAANEASHPRAAFTTAVDAICEYTGAAIGHGYGRSREDRHVLVPSDIWHLDDDRFDPFRRATEDYVVGPGEGLPGTVLASGTACWTTEFVGARGPVSRELGIRSGFAFPVLVNSRVAAVLEFFSTQALEPDPDLLDMLADVGAQLGRVIERATLHEQQLDLATSRSRFVANAAHELRTPLATMRTVAGLLGTRRDDMTPDEVEQCCDILERQGRHLEALVGDLLDLTNIEQRAGDEPLVPAAIDELLAEALEIAPPPEGVTVGTDFAPDVVVACDRPRLIRVFVNLLTNAYRHGGPRVHISTVVADGRVVATVEDDGAGVSPTIAAQMFEPFTRGTSRGESGNGLGLAIARGIVDHHGGSLDHEPRVPNGARFVVRLPVVAP